MCTARLFSKGVDLFALKFHLDKVVPISRSFQQKTRDTGLPDGEDRILLCFLVLTQYRSVTLSFTQIYSYIIVLLSLQSTCSSQCFSGETDRHMTQYRNVTDGQTERQTDGRICCSIYSAVKHVHHLLTGNIDITRQKCIGYSIHTFLYKFSRNYVTNHRLLEN